MIVYTDVDRLCGCKITRIYIFVMYYIIDGVFGSSLLIESTDSMFILPPTLNFAMYVVCNYEPFSHS